MALLHVNFHSKVLNMDTKIGVIMPQKMQGIGLAGSEQADNFPVLWLLHGRSDDYTIWMRRTSIERYAAPLGLMVIMPEVSYSRYINMKHGPRYYDYISKELPEFCAKLFPKMSRKREDNYIAGLSMGGGGAMWVGLNNPDKYGRICMLSTGGVAPLEHLWRNKSGSDYMFKKCNEDIYGTSDSDSLAGTEYDILKLIQDTAKEHTILPKYTTLWVQKMSDILLPWRSKKPLKTFPVIHISMNTTKVPVSMSGSSGMNGSNISLTLLR